LFETIEKSLQNNHIPIHKVISLGTDGAENMVGLNKGVNAHFRTINPFLLNVHCWLHRLALANKDIMKDLDYLKEFKGIICDLYTFFKRSSINSQKLREQQIIFDEKEVKLLRLCEVRWLSLYRCVINLQKSMRSIMMVLDNELQACRGKKLKKIVMNTNTTKNTSSYTTKC